MSESAVLKELALPNGVIPLPSYLPDATYGVVRGADASDLETVGIDALVMNVFHLMQKPGSGVIQALGGLHNMAGWHRPILTDSGGFQAYSLIRQNSDRGSLSDQGIRFKPEGSTRPFLLSPVKSIQLQMAYGADILICLDDCTHADDSTEVQKEAVIRTLRWAKKCKEEFNLQLKQRKLYMEIPRPLLFGVIQGGGNLSLRRECAERLQEIGFDGYGYGGWPLDAQGYLLADLLEATRSFVPANIPMHALGVGSPSSVLTCSRMGYSIFDCSLPTRDARSGRLYYWRSSPSSSGIALLPEQFDILYIDDEKLIRTNTPISPHCDCLACTRYSIAYLRHLRRCQDTLYVRLATLHNLRFMVQLMERLRIESQPPV